MSCESEQVSLGPECQPKEFELGREALKTFPSSGSQWGMA